MHRANMSLRVSLLIAFAASTAAASVSPQTVAATLARERGVKVEARDVHLQLSGERCSSMHVLRLRRFEKHVEVVLRCARTSVPFVAIVSNFPTVSEFHRGNRSSTIPPLVRRGAAVRLVINEEKSRITIPAICLEAGRLGESIRVRIPGGNRVRVARVASATNVVEEVP